MGQVVFVPCLLNIECSSEFPFPVVFWNLLIYLFACTWGLGSFTTAASKKGGGGVAVRRAVRYTNWQSRCALWLRHLVKGSVLEENFY